MKMDEKIPKILKRDQEQVETAENKRQQVSPTQWEAILLEQLAPHSKTNASRILLTLNPEQQLKRKQIGQRILYASSESWNTAM